MAEFLTDESIVFIFDLCDVVRTGVALLEVVLVKMTIEMVGISNGWFLCLINCV